MSTFLRAFIIYHNLHSMCALLVVHEVQFLRPLPYFVEHTDTREVQFLRPLPYFVQRTGSSLLATASLLSRTHGKFTSCDRFHTSYNARSRMVKTPNMRTGSCQKVIHSSRSANSTQCTIVMLSQYPGPTGMPVHLLLVIPSNF